MESISGEDGLEMGRSTAPSSSDGSTLVNSIQPWTYDLQSNPEDNRSANPTLTVQFVRKVEVRGFILQGNTNGAEDVTFLLSVSEDFEEFADVLDSSEMPLVSTGNGLALKTMTIFK